jgi:hypothetical protein
MVNIAGTPLANWKFVDFGMTVLIKTFDTANWGWV